MIVDSVHVYTCTCHFLYLVSVFEDAVFSVKENDVSQKTVGDWQSFAG